MVAFDLSFYCIWRFWLIFTGFCQYWSFWPYWPFLTVLTILDSFGQFFSLICDLIDRFWPSVLPLFTVYDCSFPGFFDRIGHIWPFFYSFEQFLTAFNHFWLFSSSFLLFLKPILFIFDYAWSFPDRLEMFLTVSIVLFFFDHFWPCLTVIGILFSTVFYPHWQNLTTFYCFFYHFRQWISNMSKMVQRIQYCPVLSKFVFKIIQIGHA